MHRRTPILAVVAGFAALAPAASAAPGDVVNKAEANFPTLATTATVEKIEGKDGLDLRAVGSDGRPVDVEALLGEDRAKQRDAFGALDAPLARHLDGLADDELVPVAIWLVEPERALGRRPKEGTRSEEVDRLAQLQTERRAAEVAEVTTPFLERLRQFDKEAAASTSSPLVWAKLPAGFVRELARDEQVDTIYGDLEKGGPETNLSRGVVGADLAPANTLDGSGVQVGIVESGGVADTAQSVHEDVSTPTGSYLLLVDHQSDRRIPNGSQDTHPRRRGGAGGVGARGVGGPWRRREQGRGQLPDPRDRCNGREDRGQGGPRPPGDGFRRTARRHRGAPRRGPRQAARRVRSA